jgi:hypothetical protein
MPDSHHRNACGEQRAICDPPSAVKVGVEMKWNRSKSLADQIHRKAD